MKYSIILPSHDPDLEHHEMFINMISSIDLNSKGRDYELIIRKNGKSYVESFNDALLSSRGDYIISVQDDMVIKDERWLEKLTDEDCFVTTEINKFEDGSDCPYWAIFGMPRKIFDKVGLLDEIYKDGVCYEDEDYLRRIRDAGFNFKLQPISYKHIGGVSTDFYLKDKKELVKKNYLLYKNKWNL